VTWTSSPEQIWNKTTTTVSQNKHTDAWALPCSFSISIPCCLWLAFPSTIQCASAESASIFFTLATEVETPEQHNCLMRWQTPEQHDCLMRWCRGEAPLGQVPSDFCDGLARLRNYPQGEESWIQFRHTPTTLLPTTHPPHTTLPHTHHTPPHHTPPNLTPYPTPTTHHPTS
jgi:hypothetical protein